jgi:hypothetical protein
MRMSCRLFDDSSQKIVPKKAITFAVLDESQSDAFISQVQAI